MGGSFTNRELTVTDASSEMKDVLMAALAVITEIVQATDDVTQELLERCLLSPVKL